MDYIYREEFHIAGNAVDRFNRLKPSALLDMMQQVATNQCALLDLDWNSMAKRGLFWAITRQHVQLLRPVLGSTRLTVETWPGITSRVAYPRSTVGYDEAGNEVFRAISLWVLMDIDNRKMVLPGKSGLDFSGIDRGCELAVPVSLAPVKLEGNQMRQVRYSELDVNGHMSNTRYLDWMMDLLPSAFHAGHNLQEFTVSYLREAKEGENICLNYELEPDGSFRLEAKEGESDHRVFAVKAAFSPQRFA